METDGNLVIYDEDHHRRWSSGTSGTGYRAIMQADGNLVVNNKDTWGVWSSVTSGQDGAYLFFGTDGDVSVVYQGTTLWSAGTRHSPVTGSHTPAGHRFPHPAAGHQFPHPRADTSRGHLIADPLAPGLLGPGPACGDASWSRT